ncbi:MAG: hypothetical protein LUB61_06305 [Eggerthellaceae bacterium]|nr:hypothetical protein [Eggerthellaceae bacterium]
MKLDKKVLYYKEGHAPCVKLLDYMKENDIDVTKRDITDAKNEDMLIQMTGGTDVPCLIVYEEIHGDEDIEEALRKE